MKGVEGIVPVWTPPQGSIDAQRGSVRRVKGFTLHLIPYTLRQTLYTLHPVKGVEGTVPVWTPPQGSIDAQRGSVRRSPDSRGLSLARALSCSLSILISFPGLSERGLGGEGDGAPMRTHRAVVYTLRPTPYDAYAHTNRSAHASSAEYDVYIY